MGGHNRSRSVGHKNSGLSFGHVNWDTIIKFKNIKNYLSTPANEATEEALLLSTNPGPDGMLAPGRRPAPLL